MLRKATSEPSLPLSPAYQEKYMKLVAAQKEKEKDITANTTTNFNSSSNTIAISNTSSNANHQGQGQGNTHTAITLTTTAAGTSSSNTTTAFSEEEEEKFLRDLGWTPEDILPVPEITDEEILEVKNRIAKQRALSPSITNSSLHLNHNLSSDVHGSFSSFSAGISQLIDL